MAYYRTFAGDPHWITARFDSTCSGKNCTQTIKRGERAFYYPKGKHIFAVPCGHAEINENDFVACAQDEHTYNNW